MIIVNMTMIKSVDERLAKLNAIIESTEYALDYGFELTQDDILKYEAAIKERELFKLTYYKSTNEN